MEPIVQATINALGYLENGVYYPEPDCFESIRDLIRFLRNDTATALARRVCGERNIVQCDLIPIMKSPTTPDNLFDIALRLTINLCQPAVLAFGGRNPEDSDTWKAYREIEKNLANSKEAFGDVELFKVFEKKASTYFAKDWLNRNEEMKLVVERIFALVRYILDIGDTDLDKERSPQDMNSHDQLVLALMESGFTDLLISVSANASDRDFHLSILEIFAMILKQYEAKDVVEAGQIRSAEEKSRQELEMQRIMEQETEKQLAKRRQLSSRHSSFAGSYILKGLKAINRDNDMIVNKVIKNCNEIDHLDKRKVQKRIPKNRRMFDTENGKHLSALNVRLALRSFCLEMVQKSYCRLMNGCRDGAFSDRRTLGQNKADIHYFALMQFSMEFRRLAELSPEYVKATLGIEAFHHVQTQLDNYMESVRIERKEGRIHGLRAQYALSAYKELLLTLISITKSGNEEWKREVDSACSHILRVEEYRDLSSCIIRRFVPGLFSKTFLRDVVLANHAYISLVVKFVKKGMLSTVVKHRKVRKRRSKKKEAEEEAFKESTAPDMDLWQKISEELSEVLFGYVEPTTDICVIDVLLEVEDEVHQQFAMLMVQQAIRQRRITDAVGLFRGARDLWPTEGVFGTKEMTPEDEFMEILSIYLADLKEVEIKWKQLRRIAYGPDEDEDARNNALYDAELDKSGAEEEDEDEGSYDSEGYTVDKEIDFHFDDYIAKFARTDVLKWYVFLLADFETNTAELNKAILKLLHRVAFDLEMAPRLYQLSLFNIFKRLAVRFKDQSMNQIKKSQYFEIYQFGYHLLRRFYADYQKIGSKLIPEILFWKGPKESYEIVNGYGTFEIRENGTKGKEILWPEALDNELRALYEEYLLFEEKPEGVDIVEYVEQGLSRGRTRRQIIRQMKMLGLNTFGLRASRRDAERGPKSSMFMPDVVEQMRNLTEQFNSKSPSSRQDDLVTFIRNNLPEKYTRAKIIKQLQYEGIHYEPPPKKRRAKVQQKWAEQEGDGLNEDHEGFSGDAVALQPDRPHQPELELKGKKKQRKAEKNEEWEVNSMERLSPGIIDEEMRSERSNSTISSISIESHSHNEKDKWSDGMSASGYKSSRSRVKAVENDLSIVRQTTSVVTNISSDSDDEEIILGRREPSPRAASLSDESEDGNEKRMRKKRIVESDSE